MLDQCSLVKIYLIPTRSNVANLFMDFLQTVKGVFNSSMTQISLGLGATHFIIDNW